MWLFWGESDWPLFSVKVHSYLALTQDVIGVFLSEVSLSICGHWGLALGIVDVAMTKQQQNANTTYDTQI